MLTRQCLTGHIPEQAMIAEHASAWSTHRNADQSGVDGQFTTVHDRVKLKSLYPTTEMQ